MQRQGEQEAVWELGVSPIEAPSPLSPSVQPRFGWAIPVEGLSAAWRVLGRLETKEKAMKGQVRSNVE